MQPIELLKSSNNDKIQAKRVALDNLLKLLTRIKDFIILNTESTRYQKFLQLAFRKGFASDIAQLFKELNDCNSDLSLGIMIDNEQRRKEDNRVFNRMLN